MVDIGCRVVGGVACECIQLDHGPFVSYSGSGNSCAFSAVDRDVWAVDIVRAYQRAGVCVEGPVC